MHMIKYIIRTSCTLMIIFSLGCNTQTIQPLNSELLETQQHSWQTTAANRLQSKMLDSKEPSSGQFIPFHCTKENPIKTSYSSIPLIDISLIEADIRDALLEISLITGISIIVDDSVEGIISANMVELNIDTALKVILSAGNYAYKRYPDFIFVSNQDPSNPSFHLISETCSFTPNYLKVTEIYQLIPTFYRQYITLNEVQNKINITASTPLQKRIQKDILSFDREPEQILLELTIIEVNRQSMELLGLNWNKVKNIAAQSSIKNSASAGFSKVDYRNQVVENSIFTYGEMMSQQLFSALDLLQKEGKAKIKTSPSIVTLNGKEANFTSTETIWPEAYRSSPGQKYQGLVYGVNLKVIPRISSMNKIMLDIKNASVSDYTLDLDLQPRLTSHSISNSVRIDNGDTLILGGLLQKSYRNHVDSVQGIADIKGVGGFFKHKQKKSLETEVLIIIKTSIMG